jgi:nucleoside-diphosphate-sugar epimerase
MDKRVIVTGGSGFIGTNVVASFLSAGHAVLSLDKTEPQNREHDEVFKRVDLLDAAALTEAFESFAPTHVVHMAARTDLHEKTDLAGYSANIEGVQNMVRAVSGQASVVRAMFASTKLVCPTDYRPQSMDDYCPDTFFQMIGRGRYFHPGRADPSKSFSYVGNAVFQMEKLLDAPREQIHRQVFYLSDYDEFTIRDWADAISLQMRGKKVWTMPEPMVRLAAWGGDLMKLCGYPEPPLSSFRLRNMRADTTGVPLEPTERVTGPLPYSMEQGVEATIAWLSEMGTGT